MPYALPVPGVQPVLQPALVLALQQEAQPEMMASVAAREAALPRGAPALVSVPVPFPDSLGLQIPAQSLLQPAVPRLPRAPLLSSPAAQWVLEPKVPHVRPQVQHSAPTQASSLRLLQLLRALQPLRAPHAQEYARVAVSDALWGSLRRSTPLPAHAALRGACGLGGRPCGEEVLAEGLL